MATKTIDHMDFYVAIAGYQLPSVPDQTFNSLRVSVGYRKGSGFYASFHPGWGDERMWGCLFDFSNNPLTAGASIDVEPATKNSAKRIAEMHASLELAKDVIAALFDDREWEKLKAVLQNAARFGYTEKFKEQGEAYLAARVSKRYEKAQTKFNENNNQNSTTMEKNFKAADLIGKTIVVGDRQATIVIKSVDGDKLSGEFTKDGKTTPMSFPMAQLQSMKEKGLWRIKNEASTAAAPTSAVSPQTSEVTTEADVQEVQDIVPVVTPRAKADGGSKTSDIKPQTSNQPAVVKPIGEHGTLVVGGVPKPDEKSDKPNGKSKDVKPADVKPADVKPETKQGAKYVYATYQTKKGKTGAKITGFASEDDVFYAMAAEIHASGSYERDKDGNKHYYLCFGPRYAEAAKSICKVLNSDKTVNQKVAECKLIVSQATEERAVKKEEGRRKREEYKAQASAVSPQPSKDYSKEDVAAMLRKVLAGGDIPEDIKALMKAA